MLIQFKVVADGSDWMLDTVQMRWTRNDGDSDKAAILELGRLIFVGLQGPFRIFALEGRTTSTEGPGNGLCTFGYALMDLDTTATFYIQANVPIKDLISKRPIDVVKYLLIPQENDNENQSREESSGPQKPEVSRSVSTGETETEQSSPEASIQPGE